MKYFSAFMAFAAAMLLVACDDETGTLGISSDDDNITTTTQTFQFTTRSLSIDSIMANSTKCYLGQVYDPETDTQIRAEFMAQFFSFENYKLPADSLLVKTDGQLLADSVDLRIYFTDYYGTWNNPMKMDIYELDRQNVLREDTTYYSDIDIQAYLPADAQPLASKTFTPTDYTLSDAQRSASSYNTNVRIRLPQEFGTRILQTAIEHPEYFLNAWEFNHHVFPGFYFHLHSGIGTMLTVDVSSLNIYFKYRDVVKDTIYVGISRFSATPEVIQSTHIQNTGIETLLQTAQPFTYLKAPAGIITEATLPVDEIFNGHENDSINRARIILTRYNSSSQTGRELGPPQQLLMLRKAELYSFFSNRKVADGRTSYTTAFNSSLNTYTFSNISRLLSFLHNEKQKGMAEEGLTSEQWEQRHPEWNRMAIVPVSITTSTNQSSGTTTQVAINHDFSLSSTRIVGGTEPLQMEVIYSHYR